MLRKFKEKVSVARLTDATGSRSDAHIPDVDDVPSAEQLRDDGFAPVVASAWVKKRKGSRGWYRTRFIELRGSTLYISREQPSRDAASVYAEPVIARTALCVTSAKVVRESPLEITITFERAHPSSVKAARAATRSLSTASDGSLTVQFQQSEVADAWLGLLLAASEGKTAPSSALATTAASASEAATAELVAMATVFHSESSADDVGEDSTDDDNLGGGGKEGGRRRGASHRSGTGGDKGGASVRRRGGSLTPPAAQGKGTVVDPSRTVPTMWNSLVEIRMMHSAAAASGRGGAHALHEHSARWYASAKLDRLARAELSRAKDGSLKGLPGDLKRLVRHGIPDSARGGAWLLLFGLTATDPSHAAASGAAHDLRRCLRSTFSWYTAWPPKIEADVPAGLVAEHDVRPGVVPSYGGPWVGAFARLPLTPVGVGVAKILMCCLAQFDSDIRGFCPSISAVLGTALVYLPACDALALTRAVLKSGCLPRTLEARQELVVMCHLAVVHVLPRLASQLEAAGVDLCALIEPWVDLCFLPILPYSLAAQFLDCLFSEGQKIFVRVVLAVFHAVEQPFAIAKARGLMTSAQAVYRFFHTPVDPLRVEVVKDIRFHPPSLTGAGGGGGAKDAHTNVRRVPTSADAAVGVDVTAISEASSGSFNARSIEMDAAPEADGVGGADPHEHGRGREGQGAAGGPRASTPGVDGHPDALHEMASEQWSTASLHQGQGRRLLSPGCVLTSAWAPGPSKLSPYGAMSAMADASICALSGASGDPVVGGPSGVVSIPDGLEVRRGSGQSEATGGDSGAGGSSLPPLTASALAEVPEIETTYVSSGRVKSSTPAGKVAEGTAVAQSQAMRTALAASQARVAALGVGVVEGDDFAILHDDHPAPPIHGSSFSGMLPGDAGVHRPLSQHTYASWSAGAQLTAWERDLIQKGGSNIQAVSGTSAQRVVHGVADLRLQCDALFANAFAVHLSRKTMMEWAAAGTRSVTDHRLKAAESARLAGFGGGGGGNSPDQKGKLTVPNATDARSPMGLGGVRSACVSGDGSMGVRSPCRVHAPPNPRSIAALDDFVYGSTRAHGPARAYVLTTIPPPGLYKRLFLCDSSSVISSAHEWELLFSWLPRRLKDYGVRRCYSTDKDGWSLAQLMRKVKELDELRDTVRVPFLLMIETSAMPVASLHAAHCCGESSAPTVQAPHRFGVYFPESIRNSGGRFVGNEEAFVFGLAPHLVRHALPVGTERLPEQQQFMYCDPKQLAFGGSSPQSAAIWLDETLLRGASARTDTFANAPLAPGEFTVRAVRVVAVALASCARAVCCVCVACSGDLSADCVCLVPLCFLYDRCLFCVLAFITAGSHS